MGDEVRINAHELLQLRKQNDRLRAEVERLNGLVQVGRIAVSRTVELEAERDALAENLRWRKWPDEKPQGDTMNQYVITSGDSSMVAGVVTANTGAQKSGTAGDRLIPPQGQTHRTAERVNERQRRCAECDLGDSVNNSILMIAIHDAGTAIENDMTTEQMLKAAMTQAQDFWLATDDDTRFRGAVGAVMKALGKEHEDYRHIADEMESLSKVSAMLTATQSGLTVEPPELTEPKFGLMKLWREAKERNNGWADTQDSGE